MDGLLYLIYTHSEYDDILQIHLKRLGELFPNLQVAICSNDIELIQNKYGNLYNFYGLYQYDNNAVYGERVLTALKNISHKYILFNHEINVLVNDVNQPLIRTILDKMEDESIDQVRLFVSGIPNPQFTPEVIHPIREGYFFSCNTAIWKANSFFAIFEKFRTTPFRSFENNEIQEYVSKFKSYYLASPNDFICPGEGHSYSTNFPTIHITHGGKWRMTPLHTPFIERFAQEFLIDLNIRGFSQ